MTDSTAETPQVAKAWYTVEQHGEVEIKTTVPGYAWRCRLCGWLGTGWTSPTGAEREALRHHREEHDA